MKDKLKARIRQLIAGAIKYRQWMIDNDYGINNMERMEALGRAKRLFDFYEGRDSQAQVNLVVALKDDLHKIMPSTASRRKNMRKTLLSMIAWCEGQFMQT